MSRIIQVQSNFTTGELDPRLNARIDLQQYYNALETAENVVLQPQGGASRRPGLKFISEVSDVIPRNFPIYTLEEDIQDAGVSGTEAFDEAAKIAFKPDGTRCYIKITPSDAGIAQFDLSTPWDIETVSLDGVTTDFITNIKDRFTFSHDGAYLIGTDATAGTITAYALTTAWDITGGTTANYSLYSGSFTDLRDIAFNDDGSKLYVMGHTGASSDVNLYELSTSGTVYESAYTIDVTQLVVTSPNADSYNQFDLVLDGKLFVFGVETGGNYFFAGKELGTAYDLSTYQDMSASIEEQFEDIPDFGYGPAGLDAWLISNNTNSIVYLGVFSTQAVSGGRHLYNVTRELSDLQSYKLVPFEVSIDDSYMLILSGQKFAVAKDQSLIPDLFGNGLYDVPYKELYRVQPSYLDSLNFTQAADTLILCHPDMIPQKILRTSDTNWTITDLEFSYIPKYAYTMYERTPNFTITPSDTTGNITIEATGDTADSGTAQSGASDRIRLRSGTHFTAGIEPQGYTVTITGGTGSGQSRYIRSWTESTQTAYVYPEFDTAPDNTSTYTVQPFAAGASEDQYMYGGNGFGRVRITEVVDGDTCKGYVEIPFFDTSGITNAVGDSNWYVEFGYEDVWSVARGWPNSAVFHEGRLYFGGSKSRPSTLWGSRVNDFFNFDPGEQLDDASIEITLDTGKFNAINNMYSGRDLQIFTSGGEFAINQTLGDPITPSTIAVKEQTSNGSKRGMPVINIDGATLFINRSGKTLAEFIYDDGVASYVSLKVSLLSSHLLTNPTSMALRKSLATDDGDRVMLVNSDTNNLVCFSLLKSEKIVAPSKWTTNGKFLSVGVDITDTYVVVERIVDGVAKIYLELLDNNAHTDSSVYDLALSSPASTVSLPHLNGFEVNVVSDGVIEANQTVPTASDDITFATAAQSSYEVGIPFTATIKTMPFEGRLPSGSTRTFKKRIVEIIADLYESQGVTINGEAAQFDTGANNVITPYTGFKRKGSLLGYTEDASVTITQDKPVDMTVLSLDYKVSTGQ